MAEKNSFIFYRSFFEAASALPPEDKPKLLEAITEFALNQREIELSPLAQGMFCLIKPLLEANHRRFANGTKGGRPKTETKPKPNLTHKLNVTETKPYNTNTNSNYNKNTNITPPDEIPFEFEVIAKNAGLDPETCKMEYVKFRNYYKDRPDSRIKGFAGLWENWCLQVRKKTVDVKEPQKVDNRTPAQKEKSEYERLITLKNAGQWLNPQQEAIIKKYEAKI